MTIAVLNPTLVQRGGPPSLEFIAFIIFWVGLGLGSFLFFRFSHNTPLKRRVWLVDNVATGIIFGAFVFFSSGRQQPQILFVLVPVLVIIMVLNIKTTRFCDACGKMLTRQPIFSRTHFCPYCGAELR